MKKMLPYILTVVITGYIGVTFGYNMKQPSTKSDSLQTISAAPQPLIAPTEIWQGINQQREAFGSKPVNLNISLNKSAASKCTDMVSRHYFEHVDPDGNHSWGLIGATYGAYSSVGENLAEGFFDSSAVVVGWMNSPSHKKVLLDNKYTDVGIAVCDSGADNNGLYVVSHYATK